MAKNTYRIEITFDTEVRAETSAIGGPIARSIHNCLTESLPRDTISVSIGYPIRLASHGINRVVDDELVGHVPDSVSNLRHGIAGIIASSESKESASLCSCRMGTESLSHAISCPCSPNYEHYMAGFPLVVTRHESVDNGKALVIPDTQGDEQGTDVSS